MKKLNMVVLFFGSLLAISCSSTPQTVKPVVMKTLNLKASKSQVWSALTKEEELAQWWNKKVKLEPKMGGSFYEPWGKGQLATGKVIDIEPQKRIQFTWKEKTWKSGEESVCEFLLSEENGLTTLIVKHTGWESFSNSQQIADGFSRGWDFILPKLKSYFEKK